MQKTTARVLRLAEITEDHAPERLIELIQNRSGKIPASEREEALHALCKRFQYLIQSVAQRLYFKAKLHQHGYDLVDFTQDVITEFISLVVEDFKLKTREDEPGFLVFGYYIKTRLPWRMMRWLEEKFKAEWGNEIPHNFDRVDDSNLEREDGRHKSADFVDKEIREAILANALYYDEVVLNHIEDEQVRKLLNEMIDISNTVLDERHRRIWYLYYCSEKRVNEIAEMFASTQSEGPISRARVLQIAQRANDKVLAEFGRRQGLRRPTL